MVQAVPTERFVLAETVMGTVVSFDIRGNASVVAAAVDRATAFLHDVDATFSTYRAGSAIRRIDRGELALADASAEVRWILRRCEEIRRETAGYFDARATGTLDPSALVKGWAVERSARILEEAGLRDFCLTGGGDVVCRGGALPAHGWRIGVQHPTDPAAIAAIVAGSGFAVATSGTYERGDHIRNPHLGVAPTGLLSVTVTGPDLGTADAYSTAAFAMATHGPAWTAHLPARGYEAMTILADGTVQSTPDFPFAQDAS